jgi:hypothetical protein
MIERGALTEQVKSIEDIPEDKRQELLVEIKTMILKSNLAIQDSFDLHHDTI